MSEERKDQAQKPREVEDKALKGVTGGGPGPVSKGPGGSSTPIDKDAPGGGNQEFGLD